VACLYNEITPCFAAELQAAIATKPADASPSVSWQAGAERLTRRSAGLDNRDEAGGYMSRTVIGGIVAIAIAALTAVLYILVVTGSLASRCSVRPRR
jgi:hypothetical protein